MKAWEMSERARKVLKEILTTGRYVSACHDRFKFEVDVKAGEQFIEAYATEREAQAVQREREAARGFADLVKAIVNNRGECFIPTTGDEGASMELYEWDEKAHALLDTYNDNRKG
jgi:hypothetical protein